MAVRLMGGEHGIIFPWGWVDDSADFFVKPSPGP